MAIERIHHVAYRCRDTRETIDFYRQALGMDVVLLISEDRVPSTKEPDPYMHIFIDIGGGNILAFFELPTQPEMVGTADANTPAWTQHLALTVDSMDALLQAKARLQAGGIDVIGPVNHTLFQSIYFFDPSGHRLELAVNTATPQMNRALDDVKWAMLDEWDRTKKAPQHAAWLHEKARAAHAAAKARIGE